MPAAAQTLAMKTMNRENRNLQQLHSISQISSSHGLERKYNAIKNLAGFVCAMSPVTQGVCR
jgi:hypothetical protein